MDMELKMLMKELKIESEIGIGTKVKVTIPIRK